VRRYYTNTTERLLKKYLQMRELRDEALRNVRARMYERFDEYYIGWLQVIKHLAEMDCYLGLAICRDTLGSPLCRPTFVESDENIFEVEELRHPCINTGYIFCFL
jgi:DNA mismatch repair protein MSH6